LQGGCINAFGSITDFTGKAALSEVKCGEVLLIQFDLSHQQASAEAIIFAGAFEQLFGLVIDVLLQGLLRSSPRESGFGQYEFCEGKSHAHACCPNNIAIQIPSDQIQLFQQGFAEFSALLTGIECKLNGGCAWSSGGRRTGGRPKGPLMNGPGLTFHLSGCVEEFNLTNTQPKVKLR